MCRRFRVVALVVALSAIGVTVVRADDLCGATIVADLTLDQDLFCVAGGLIVAADGISLQLNGHTINGSGTGVGIGVRGRRQVSIKGGTVRGFESGIMLANSQHVVIMEMMFTQNREGIFVSGSTGVIVKENVAWANFQRGFMIRPSSTQTSRLNQIVENILTDNPVGVLLFGQPDNTLKENVISGSSSAAIFLTGGGASGNLIKENDLTTSLAGIQFGPGWTANTIAENTFHSNSCGVSGPTVGNVFKENQYTNNGLDVCP